MRFVRLKIAGFKSFVDPVEAPIEEGVTGIVGPNGCGKSNLLEALRWVMGATSAKAMRAGGMDDVIFSGTTERPARNHAEVTLVIDNSDQSAPARLGRESVIEITRRISRGQGSTYRVNGRETRARDVQILFADASSGANSPALVRQGQISELIAAKPENRRRVLEEAAGVAGLRARRHEAELKLKAAETNLERLDDIAGEQERRLDALRRQAREAQRYRKLSLEIRALETRQHLLRWSEAGAAKESAERERTAAENSVAEAETESARAAAAATEIAAELSPAREEEAVAGAIAGRLARQREDLDRRVEAARAEAAALKTRIGELDAESQREKARRDDAERELARLAEDPAAQPDAAAEAAAQAKLSAAEHSAALKDAARAQAEGALDQLSASRADALAARAAAAATRDAAEARLEAAQNELKRLGPAPEGEALAAAEAEAKSRHVAAQACEQELSVARDTLAAAETAIDKAERAQAKARDEAARHKAALGRLVAERDAFDSLIAKDKGDVWPPAADAISVAPGYERALAAALGDDLQAALDDAAPAFWSEGGVEGPSLPSGAKPISEFVDAPPVLAARLAQIGVVESDAGARLAAKLAPGQRLVTRAGMLWRWDGLRVTADAPSPAAALLERRARLAALHEEIAAAQGAAKKTAKTLAAKDKALATRKSELAAARPAADAAERAAREARRAADVADAAVTRARDALEARNQAHARASSERDAAQIAVRAAEAVLAATPDPNAGETAIETARAAAETSRAHAAEARASVESLRRAIADAAGRREEFARAVARWRERKAEAEARLKEVAAQSVDAATRLESAESAPAEAERAAAKAAKDHAAAETRRKKAADAAAAIETRARAADAAQREAERKAASAREARAEWRARAQAAGERLEEIENLAREALGADPRELPEDAAAAKLDAADVEKKLSAARAGRDRLGAVNLAADEEAETLDKQLEKMRAERADLLAAIAKLRAGVAKLNEEGRTRLTAAFETIDGHFRKLFQTLFDGGEARLALVDADDPLEAGLDIHVCPPGKKLGSLSLLSGGEQALTATALIFAVFLSNPSPLCALDEVDAPLDDANVDRFCRLMEEMRRLTDTRFVVITHNPVTMSRMDRLYGVTMSERGVSQLVSVDLQEAERLAAAE